MACNVIACLLLFAPVYGKMEQLQPNALQVQFSSTLSQLLPASKHAIVGIVYSNTWMQQDQASNWLQADILQVRRVPVLFQLDGLIKCSYTGIKLKHVVMFVEGGLSKLDVFFNCTQAWISQSTFYFVLLRHNESVLKLVEDVWTKHKLLNYLVLYADEELGQVRRISFNPFTRSFSNNVTSKLKNMHGFKIRAIYTVNSIKGFEDKMDDHIQLLWYVSSMLNASIQIDFQENYNPYEQFERILRDEADIDLNPAIVNWSQLESCVGVSYGGPLVTLIPKQSGSFTFALLIFDIYSWLTFDLFFFALATSVRCRFFINLKHSWKLLMLSKGTLSFFFFTLFQIYIISALTSSGNIQTIDTIQGLVDHNMTIIVPIRMDTYLPTYLQRQMKIVYISEAYGKLVGHAEPARNEAIVIWQISFDKLKYARPGALARFYPMKEPIGVISSARHAKANSPFKDSFELAMDRMKEACLSRTSCLNWNKQKLEEQPQRHLDLKRMLNVFYILILGSGLSLAVFVAELMVSRISRFRSH